MKLVIVSGLSGSGKTVALHTLEDEDFYCVDSLHFDLLSALIKHLTNSDFTCYDKAAIGIDARNCGSNLESFPRFIEKLRTSTGMDVTVLFLQADEKALIKRFSETRRKHPLTHQGSPLVKAIRLERSMLSIVSSCADLIIDTSHTNVHQLRKLIRKKVCPQVSTSLSILFQSFGYKHGIPVDSDYVFDVRCLPNPYWVPNLRGLTGQNIEVANYLQAQESVEQMYISLRDFIDKWIPYYEADNRVYLSISIGCTGGQHRSVYLVERLANNFRTTRKSSVSIRHIELEQ